MQVLKDSEYVDLPEDLTVLYEDTDSGRLYHIEGFGSSYSLSYLLRRAKWGYMTHDPEASIQPAQNTLPIKSNQMWLGRKVPTGNQGQVGDMFLDTAHAMLYGPKTTRGWGDPSPIGTRSTSPNTAGILHVQEIPSSVWVVEHNLGYDPVILRVMDEFNRQLSGEVIYSKPGTEITIIFDDPYAGQARLI